jgi:hypothetical protein
VAFIPTFFGESSRITASVGGHVSPEPPSFATFTVSQSPPAPFITKRSPILSSFACAFACCSNDEIKREADPLCLYSSRSWRFPLGSPPSYAAFSPSCPSSCCSSSSASLKVSFSVTLHSFFLFIYFLLFLVCIYD